MPALPACRILRPDFRSASEGEWTTNSGWKLELVESQTKRIEARDAQQPAMGSRAPVPSAKSDGALRVSFVNFLHSLRSPSLFQEASIILEYAAGLKVWRTDPFATGEWSHLVISAHCRMVVISSIADHQ